MKDILYDKGGNFKIAGLYSYYFWIGLIVKLILSCTLASGFMTTLFAPFVNYFVSGGFENPYQYFISHGNGNEFPYPPLMLYILSLPRIILSPLFTNEFAHVSNLDIFIYRIPVLLSDFIILLILLRWLKTNHKKVLLYYWMSPILLYINYIHGQLDAIPIALAMIGLYFLFKDKFVLAAAFITLAICTKTNIFIIFPFVLIYIYRENKIKASHIWKSVVVALSIIVLMYFPYVTNPAFIQMVLKNSEQSKIFLTSYVFSPHMYFYFIPAAFLCLLIRAASFRFMNKDLLLMFLAFSFSIITILIPPMQGWYYWILPFFIYFLIKQHEKSLLLFSLLNFFYFLYFLVIPKSDFLSVCKLSFPGIPDITFYQLVSNSGIDADFIVNIVFTLLQTTLVLVALYIYRKGISTNILEKIKYQPLLMGISGDSGSGKSTLTKSLLHIFGAENISILRGDDMHKWERGDENWKKFTHLNPKANDLHHDLIDTSKLKSGQKIYRKHYDHDVGKFTLPVTIKANKLIIYEGLHPFYLKKQTALFDFKIFIKPEESLRKHWKVIRDIAKRGYSKETVLQQMDHREIDSQKYIMVQEKYADMVISYYSTAPIKNLGDPEENLSISLRLEFDQNMNIEPLLYSLDAIGVLEIDHLYEDEKQIVLFSGDIFSEAIESVAFDTIPELEDLGIYNSQWEEGYKGVIQLAVCYLMFQKINLKKI